jgi:predicted phosphodiesterase
MFGMFAIVSDIHANLEAFTTVLAEIDRRGVQHIVCLGDIVGPIRWNASIWSPPDAGPR